MAKMNLTPLSAVVDEVWGEKGTSERDVMEARLKEDLQAYYIGEAIKEERLKQDLTQEELGAKVGVKKSQISKLESGKCIITLPTMSKVFKALGFDSAPLDLGIGGKVALW
ncbi:MAG: helix-turn-helix domain-containing protein [Paraprevotella sp.]|nr:helix-turn-helix domain-containing protein [Paraprevotella sp.]